MQPDMMVEENPNLRTVYLHGALGRKFGWRHRLAVATPREAVTALSVLRKGFHEYFWREPAHYTFVRGATLRNGTDLNEFELGMLLGKEDFHIVPVTVGAGGGGKGVGKIVLGAVMVVGAFFTAGATLGFGAAAGAGAGGAAAGGAAAGAGAAAAGAGAAAAGGLAWGASVGGLGLITAGQLATLGGMMMLGGVSQLLSPTPHASPSGPGSTYSAMESPAARQSFLYNGPANTMEQGGAVPIIYGTMRVGSTLMSATITSEELL